MEIEISSEIKKLLGTRGVREEEIAEVIQHAETTGEKLYQPGSNKYLGKLRISEATFYVEYSVENEKYMVHTSYLHRSQIIEE